MSRDIERGRKVVPAVVVAAAIVVVAVGLFGVPLGSLLLVGLFLLCPLMMMGMMMGMRGSRGGHGAVGGSGDEPDVAGPGTSARGIDGTPGRPR